jgi:hypothetical protein
MALFQLMRSVFSLWRQTPVRQSSLFVVSPETRMLAPDSQGTFGAPPPPLPLLLPLAEAPPALDVLEVVLDRPPVAPVAVVLDPPF